MDGGKKLDFAWICHTWNLFIQDRAVSCRAKHEVLAETMCRAFRMNAVPPLIILWTILCLALNRCLGGRFYCRPKNGLIVYISRSTHIRQPDYLVFEEDEKPEPLDSQWRRCSWVLELDAAAPRQVVLKGVQRSSLSDGDQKQSGSDSTNDTFRLSISMNNKCEARQDMILPLSLRTFIILLMSTRNQLTILKDLPREKFSLSISVSVMEPGYCAQDIVLHSGKCHQVIEQQNSSLTEATKIISSSSSGGLQLASFTSLEEIKMFVKTNYEPEDDFPPKQPLDLKNPVRIGLFYSRSSNSVFESVKTDNGCKMRKLLNSDEFVSVAKILDGACGALQAMNSESAVIQFVSCNHPMSSLISFSETPQNTTCLDCNQIIDKWLGDEKQHDLPKKLNITMVAIIITSLIGLALLAGSVLAIALCCCHSESNSLPMDRTRENGNPLMASTGISTSEFT